MLVGVQRTSASILEKKRQFGLLGSTLVTPQLILQCTHIVHEARHFLFLLLKYLRILPAVDPLFLNHARCTF